VSVEERGKGDGGYVILPFIPSIIMFVILCFILFIIVYKEEWSRIGTRAWAKKYCQSCSSSLADPPYKPPMAKAMRSRRVAKKKSQAQKAQRRSKKKVMRQKVMKKMAPKKKVMRLRLTMNKGFRRT
jgi:hypothetical protein